MKVLFVCRGNAARSQMAEGIYNSLAAGPNAESAGTCVEKPGQSLSERKRERQKQGLNSYVLDAMCDIGIDMSTNTSTQLTKDMLTQYDLIVSMAAKRYTPKWLAEAPNYVYWKVRDPMGRSYAATAAARDHITQLVRELLVQRA